MKIFTPAVDAWGVEGAGAEGGLAAFYNFRITWEISYGDLTIFDRYWKNKVKNIVK